MKQLRSSMRPLKHKHSLLPPQTVHNFTLAEPWRITCPREIISLHHTLPSRNYFEYINFNHYYLNLRNFILYIKDASRTNGRCRIRIGTITRRNCRWSSRKTQSWIWVQSGRFSLQRRVPIQSCGWSIRNRNFKFVRVSLKCERFSCEPFPSRSKQSTNQWTCVTFYPNWVGWRGRFSE